MKNSSLPTGRLGGKEVVAESPSVLILGASGVLGSALADAFPKKAYRVLGTGFRHCPKTQLALQLDATRASEMPKIGKWIDDHTSRLDVVIHCIGIAQDSLLARMSDQEWRQVVEVNLKSAYLLSKLLLPRLVKQGGGRWIFISSWAGRTGRSGQANYAAAKAGLIGLTQSMAREYASRGVVINCVVPGVFKSPMTERLSQTMLERLWGGAALKQFADLNEIVQFIVHLAGMRGVTGQVFQLDGRIAPVLE